MLDWSISEYKGWKLLLFNQDISYNRPITNQSQKYYASSFISLIGNWFYRAGDNEILPASRLLILQGYYQSFNWKYSTYHDSSPVSNDSWKYPEKYLTWTSNNSLVDWLID